ncbi:MAG: hypothetical protein AAF740_08930, partial [Bacteroidota bacterium]
MKRIILLLALVSYTLTLNGQNIEPNTIWRTKGVFDSSGKFLEREKVQTFLSPLGKGKVARIVTQDRINMETGETKVFVFLDTLVLTSDGQNKYKTSRDELFTVHSKDSVTIEVNGYTLPYVKIAQKQGTVKLSKLK